MFCTNCGSKLIENARFCQTCGAPTGIDGPVAAPVSVKPEVNEPAESPAGEAEVNEPAESPAGEAEVNVSAESPAGEVKENVTEETQPDVISVTDTSETQELIEIVASADGSGADVAAGEQSGADVAAGEQSGAGVAAGEQSGAAGAAGEQSGADVAATQGFDVPDMTIVANKWLPDDPQILAETEPAKKKKSKKGLIIILCVIVALLGTAIGLAFLFSGKYSKKVDELESYQSSPVIEEMKDEYSDLLERAKASEGVLHVFGMFSMNNEVDEFLDRIDIVKEELPEKALEAQKKLERLGKTYYIEDWGAKVGQYDTDIKSMIENKDYDSLVKIIHDCDNLGKEIVAGNETYKKTLDNVVNELTDMRTELPAYALYKEEADIYLEQATAAANEGMYQDIPYYVNKGNAFIDTIKEANRPYEEVGDRKEYYDQLFSVVEIKDTDRYNKILADYTNALMGGSEAALLSAIVSEYADLYEETHSQNTDEYLELRNKLDEFDTTVLTSEELIEYNSAYEQMKSGESEDKTAKALTFARECMKYVDKYSQKITESKKFLDLISALPVIEALFESYDQELSEEELYYICTFLLSSEQIKDIRETLGWGADVEQGLIAGWNCGFSRTECEELAYYITGNKHYFYKDISSYAADYEEYSDQKNAGIVRKSDFTVSENDDETINIDFAVQIRMADAIYGANISVVAVYNEDSYFDKYSAVSLTMTDVWEVDHRDVFIKALNELYEEEPDKFGDDILFSRQMSLVYIDDDFVPELYINSIYGSDSAYLITYVDNDNYSLTLLESGNGFSEYIADIGVIRICDGHMGYYMDSVLEIMGSGEVETLFKGDYYYLEDSEVSEESESTEQEVKYNISYPEEMEDIDKKVYYDHLDECYTSKGDSQYLTPDCTYDEMIKILSENEFY
ncbi:MAG: zinc-ribbon domain-containing protein [Lachnospiraceae bacterium]|nr:zinc-ribbon domain-containing protein [Lachnospiraceae bacterium]